MARGCRSSPPECDATLEQGGMIARHHSVKTEYRNVPNLMLLTACSVRHQSFVRPPWGVVCNMFLSNLYKQGPKV